MAAPVDAEIAVALALTGTDLDPSLVSAQTGLSPSRTWRTGEPIRAGLLLRYDHSGWTIASGLSRSAGLEAHVDALLRRLESAWPALVDLCRRYEAEVACVVYSYGGARPAIHLTRTQFARLAELNASLDIDLYVLPRRRK